METENISFENKMHRLEEIVDTLDRAEEPLERLLEVYEEAVKLAASCRKFLDDSELKVIEIAKESEIE